MKWLLIILGGLAVVVAVVFAIGAMLPREHVASTRAIVNAPPDSVWNALTTVSDFPRWRGDVSKVEQLPPRGAHRAWREDGRYGTMAYEEVESVPPKRLEVRVADEGQQFGGTWTYDLQPKGDRTQVTITENGFVNNALFRFMSRYVFGHHASQEAYLRALGRKFGQDITPQRVSAGT
jgi:uncharacterized protein YndB with AHSA1/START domain